MPFYVISALVMLAGIFIFINPIESASLPAIVLGTSFIVYGVMETVLSVQTMISNKRLKKAEAEYAVEVIDEKEQTTNGQKENNTANQ